MNEVKWFVLLVSLSLFYQMWLLKCVESPYNFGRQADGQLCMLCPGTLHAEGGKPGAGGGGGGGV